MSDVKLTQRKQALEKEARDLQAKKVNLVAMISSFQKQVSEVEKAQYLMDGKYQMLCEMLGLDATAEWKKSL